MPALLTAPLGRNKFRFMMNYAFRRLAGRIIGRISTPVL